MVKFNAKILKISGANFLSTFAENQNKTQGSLKNSGLKTKLNFVCVNISVSNSKNSLSFSIGGYSLLCIYFVNKNALVYFDSILGQPDDERKVGKRLVRIIRFLNNRTFSLRFQPLSIRFSTASKKY